MNSSRLGGAAILLCAATSGCYMNIKGVEDNGRLTGIEQRLSTLEQALGIPTPPPPQVGPTKATSNDRVKSAAYAEDEEAASGTLKGVPAAARHSSPTDNSASRVGGDADSLTGGITRNTRLDMVQATPVGHETNRDDSPGVWRTPESGESPFRLLRLTTVKPAPDESEE